MEIVRNKYVSLTYELKTGGFDGEVIDSAVEESPLSFVFGAGLMLEKFEENLLGLKKGDKFSFEIASHEGYGPADENRIVDLPKEIFEVDGKIDTEMVSVGNTLPMMDAHGNRMNGKIMDITDETIVMDFNHPLATENLFFSGAISDVREASEEELAQAAGLMSGGGCGSGCGCSDNGGCGSGGCGTEEEEFSGGGCGSGCGCH